MTRPTTVWRILVGAVLLGALLGAAPAPAQPPDLPWLTFETEHFRLHCPAATRLWCERLAARLEPAREAVAAAVGHFPARTIDLVIADPAAAPNGSAWPLLGSPRAILWTTPPAAASTLSPHGDWGELVLVHELVHLAHLTRPSRAPLRGLAERTLWPLSPIATKAPRWVIEGYATLAEGRLTGSGRPHGAWRPALLRRFARAGRLPDYGALSAGDDAFFGRSMAYLAGSAFLEWLETRTAPGGLDRLWRRLTARTERSFTEAFAGVYGERPDRLWARFAAETTAEAVARAEAEAPTRRAGELWLDLAGATSHLALAADGERLAFVERRHRRPPRLVVAATVPDGEAALRRRERIARQLTRDPEDAPPIETGPAPVRRLAERELDPGVEIGGARFFADGDLLLSLGAPGPRGDRVFDLHRWRPGDRRARRLTRGAGLTEADPHPAGSRAVAIQRRDGFSALVEVELDGGAVRILEGPAVDRGFDQPRYSLDGGRLAWLEHRQGRWQARLRQLPDGAAVELELPAGGEPLQLAWRADGTLVYAAVARGDAIEIEALPAADGARWHQVTHGVDVALYPTPTPDGTALFHLLADADGLDLARLDLDAATWQPATAPPPSLPRPPSVVAVGEATTARGYGPGRLEASPLVAGWSGDSAGPLELGVRWGDLLGRTELLALASVGGGDGPRGARLAGAWRGFPLTLGLQAVRVELDGNELDGVEGDPTELDGVELSLRGVRRVGAARVEAGGGLAWARWRRGAGTGTGTETTSLWADLEVSTVRSRGALSARPRLTYAAAVPVDGASRGERQRLSLALDLASPRGRIELGLGRREVRGRGASSAPMRLGGVPSSLLPESLLPGRVAHPALPDGALAGERLDHSSLRLGWRGVPLELFGDWFEGPEERLRLVGLEARWSLAALPFLNLPTLEARAGVARPLDGRLEGDTRWWLGLVIPARLAAEARLP